MASTTQPLTGLKRPASKPTDGALGVRWKRASEPAFLAWLKRAMPGRNLSAPGEAHCGQERGLLPTSLGRSVNICNQKNPLFNKRCSECIEPQQHVAGANHKPQPQQGASWMMTAWLNPPNPLSSKRVHRLNRPQGWMLTHRYPQHR